MAAFDPLDTLARDVRYTLRTLSRAPAFAITTILTLALGVGATTAIFSVVRGVLLRPLPYDAPERIVHVWQINGEGNRANVSDPNYDDLRAQSRSFAAVAQLTLPGPVSVTGGAEPERAMASVVSREFFEVMGVRPFVGRVMAPDEARLGGSPVVVVSHGFWRRYLGADRNLGAQAITVGPRTFTVVGVMPPEFDYPTGADLWMPRELDPRTPSRTAHNTAAIARLADGVTVEQAQRDVSAIARRLKQEHGDDTWMVDAAVVPLREQIVGSTRPALLILLGASAFLLLIACANVVNLLLARMATRQRELAVRLALGAGRRRLVRQFLLESFVMALIGGAIGIALAAGGVRLLLALEPGDLPRVAEIGVDWVVLLFALAVSTVAAIGIGLLTAVRGTGGDIQPALAQSQRTQAGVGASDRIRRGLVVGQVALSVVLLAGAGVLGRSFLELVTLDPGYRTNGALIVDVSATWPRDIAGARRLVALYDGLLTRLAGLPGVTVAGGSSGLPVGGGGYGNGAFLIMSHADEPLRTEDAGALMQDPQRSGYAEFRVASADYFRAMGIPLLRGRVFDDRDEPDGPHVAVVSASLAREEWPNEDAIGKVIQFGNMDGDMRPFTIVGVVGDVRDRGLDAEPRPTFYAFYRQRPRAAGRFSIVLAGPADPVSQIPAARRVLRDLAPDIPPRFRTMEEAVSELVADRRFNLVLLAAFGGAALALAMLGIYSVTSYLVSQRERELAVRVALGAQRGDVLGLVLKHGTALAAIGVVVGVLAAFWLTRLLSGMLYGVAPTDPVAFALVVALLGGVAVVASILPARRAARLDPMQVLRGS